MTMRSMSSSSSSSSSATASARMSRRRRTWSRRRPSIPVSVFCFFLVVPLLLVLSVLSGVGRLKGVHAFIVRTVQVPVKPANNIKTTAAATIIPTRLSWSTSTSRLSASVKFDVNVDEKANATSVTTRSRENDKDVEFFFTLNPKDNDKASTTVDAAAASTTTAINTSTSSTTGSRKVLHRKDESPAARFGKPLTEELRESNRKTVHFLKGVLFDVLYAGKALDRSYARFYALETIARMPYFSYLSVLHLLETLGLWRKAEYLKVHFAQSWNELHHLLVMEELGGNSKWTDRFVAQHVAFFYYWIVVALYLHNPCWAYHLNQAVEEEAYETYDKFLATHETFLKQQAAPDIAVQYYTGNDIYLFQAMSMEEEQTATSNNNNNNNNQENTPRTPKCETLYDVFVNIRDDEKEHAQTMAYLQHDN